MSKDRDEQLFGRFRVEQLEYLWDYLREEEDHIAGEIVNAVRDEEFTRAAIRTGELDFCRVLRRRAERNLKERSNE